MKRSLMILAALACAALSPAMAVARAAAAQDARKDIQAALNDSAKGWRERDLDRFIKSYEASPPTIYVSHTEVTTGFDAIRGSYAKRFDALGVDLGQLSVHFITFRMLDSDHAFVLGRYSLARGGKPVAAGITSLLLHRGRDGWRIVADHTD